MVVEVKLDAVEDLEPVIKELVARQFTAPRWYTLKAACEFKGVSYNTVKCQPFTQPNGGKEDACINGRKMWKFETVALWAEVTDDTIAEYVRRCRDGSIALELG